MEFPILMTAIIGCGSEIEIRDYTPPPPPVVATENEEVNLPGFGGCAMTEVVLPATENGIDYFQYCPTLIAGGIEATCGTETDAVSDTQFGILKDAVLAEYSIFDLLSCNLPVTVCYEFEHHVQTDHEKSLAVYIMPGHRADAKIAFSSQGAAGLSGIACYASEYEATCPEAECGIDYTHLSGHFDMRASCAETVAGQALSAVSEVLEQPSDETNPASISEYVVNDLPPYDADCEGNDCTTLPPALELLGVYNDAEEMVRGWEGILEDQPVNQLLRNCRIFEAEK